MNTLLPQLVHLRTNPLEENDETNNVAADTSSSNEHVADTEHEIVDREGCHDLQQSIQEHSRD